MSAENKYYSMMGLLDEEKLESKYGEKQWSSFESLSEVLKMMKKSETGNEDKHSIPDVYGRMIQLRIALKSAREKSELERNYFLGRDILAWRGMLTILALHEFLGLKVKWEEVNYQGTGDAFEKALKMPPEINMLGDGYGLDGENFWVLSIQGDNMTEYTDIALYSPMTLIYPVADIQKKVPVLENLKWFDDGRREFINPVDVLSDTEKMIVCFWLDELEKVLDEWGGSGQGETEKDETIREQEGRRNELKDAVVYHLQKFRNDLEDGNIGQVRRIKTCFSCDDIQQCKDRGIVYRLFPSAVKIEFDFAGIRVGHKDLFSEQLYCIRREGNPFINCKYFDRHMVKEDEYYAFIPVGSKMEKAGAQGQIAEFIRYLEMETVYTAGTMTGIRVTWQLSEISQGNIDIEKLYRTGNGTEVVFEEGKFPVVALWPGISSPRWKKYYTYVEGLESNGMISVNCENAAYKREDNPYIWMLEEFPEMIFFSREDKGKKYDIGVICPKVVADADGNNVNQNIGAIVGIDFGTSGTTVYTCIGQDKIVKPMDISEDTSVLLTDAGVQGKEMVSRHFILAEKNAGSLYSVYRRTKEELLHTVTPIADGIIYQAHEKEMIAESKHFMANMKWENMENGAYYIAFIEELCMHIWMLLRQRNAMNITFRYALPKSMEREDETRFCNMWKNDISKFISDTIENVKFQIDNAYTESKAASLYFLKKANLNVEKGYMVIDIGGGSMDIAIWQKDKTSGKIKMLGQTSVPIAGRLLFIRWIALNFKEIADGTVLSDPDMDVREQWKKVSEFKADEQIENAIIEKIVASNSQAIHRAYDGSKDNWAKKLKAQLEMGMALLFFSLGSLAGYLQKKDIMQIEKGKGNFYLAVGGNGSRILEWLGMTDKYEKLADMFMAGIRSRGLTGDSYNVRIIKSEEPKKEVAFGLVQDEINDMDDMETEMKEDISKETAIEWNKAFIQEYRNIFGRELSWDENSLYNEMTLGDKKMDVCNFLMGIMYDKYYKKMISEIKG